MTYLDDDVKAIRESLPAGTDAPGGSDLLFRIYAVLMRAKGESVTAEDVHDAWSAWTLTRDPSHEALVPFDTLTPEKQAQDMPYVEAIHAAAEKRLRQ
jgi:hypothetical protein